MVARFIGIQIFPPTPRNRFAGESDAKVNCYCVKQDKKEWWVKGDVRRLVFWIASCMTDWQQRLQVRYLISSHLDLADGRTVGIGLRVIRDQGDWGGYTFRWVTPVRLDVRKMGFYLPLSSDAYLEIGLKDFIHIHVWWIGKEKGSQTTLDPMWQLYCRRYKYCSYARLLWGVHDVAH